MNFQRLFPLFLALPLPDSPPPSPCLLPGLTVTQCVFSFRPRGNVSATENAARTSSLVVVLPFFNRSAAHCSVYSFSLLRPPLFSITSLRVGRVIDQKHSFFWSFSPMPSMEIPFAFQVYLTAWIPLPGI